MRYCSICHKRKQRRSFYGNTSSFDGLDSRCKKCDIKRKKLWNRKNMAFISLTRKDFKKDEIIRQTKFGEVLITITKRHNKNFILPAN